MDRYDIEAWQIARQLFRNDAPDRFWSNGIHAQHLVALGESVATDAEKTVYYERALEQLYAGDRSLKAEPQ